MQSSKSAKSEYDESCGLCSQQLMRVDTKMFAGVQSALRRPTNKNGRIFRSGRNAKLNWLSLRHATQLSPRPIRKTLSWPS